MKYLLILSSLIFLSISCEKLDKNEVEFTPIIKEAEVPIAVPMFSGVSLSEVSGLELSLKYFANDYMTSSISLIDSSMDNIGKDKIVLRSKILTILKNSIQGRVDEFKLGINDSRFHRIGSWKDQFYFPIEELINSSSFSGQLSGRLSYQIRVKPYFFGKSKKISEVIIGSYFFDKKFSKMTKISSQRLVKFEGEDEIFNKDDAILSLEYDLIDENIHGPYMLGELRKRNELFLRVDDYLIEYKNGSSQRLSELLNHLENEFATIIISGGGHHKIYSTKDEISIRDYMKKKNIIIHSDGNGRLVAVDDLVSDLYLPIDWNDLSVDYLRRGLWMLQGARTVDQVLQKGKTYLIGHATVRELGHKKIKIPSIQLNNGGTINFGSLAKDEVIELTLSGKTKSAQFKTIEKSIAYTISGVSRSYVRVSPDHYESFPELNFDRIGMDCKVFDRQYIGDVERSMIFSPKELDERVTLFFDGLEHKIDNLLIEQNKPAFLNENTVAKFRIRVPYDSKRIVMIIKGNNDYIIETLGFMKWGHCPGRENAEFKTLDYELKKRKYIYKNKLELQVKSLISTVL